ncbi:matrilin-2 [Silurus meridionalis]|uniref:matrilin-2 n=1 Tax=Silurus meridionalis TaxID=175797 RepID=UPI001EEB2061|nr:matrilin-2 [Silurus meridionalis]
MDSYRPVISFIILISFHVGCSLRCACTEDLTHCTSIHNMQANFKTAQQFCMENGGKLLTETSTIIESLLFNKSGHYWIGEKGRCLSSRKHSRGDSVTLNRGEEDVECSSRCISVSNNRTLTEHLCEKQTDGFLCDGIQWETCWKDQSMEVQILNNKGCGSLPCENLCTQIPRGHMCGCYKSFRPSRENPKRCEFYCESKPCKMPCSSCECPDGFIKDETWCTDLDECMSNHNNCEQNCTNTFGSYKCSCQEGFMLEKKYKCVPLINPTPITASFFTPSVNYTMSHAAFSNPAEYICLTMLIVMVILAVIGVWYFYSRKM